MYVFTHSSVPQSKNAVCANTKRSIQTVKKKIIHSKIVKFGKLIGIYSALFFHNIPYLTHDDTSFTGLLLNQNHTLIL